MQKFRTMLVITQAVFLPHEQANVRIDKDFFIAINEMFKVPLKEKVPIGLLARNLRTGCIVNIGCLTRMFELNDSFVVLQGIQRFSPCGLDLRESKWFLPGTAKLVEEIKIKQDFLQINEPELWDFYLRILPRLRQKFSSVLPSEDKMDNFFVGKLADVLASCLSLAFFDFRLDILMECDPNIRLFKILSYLERILAIDDQAGTRKIPIRTNKEIDGGRKIKSDSNILLERLAGLKGCVTEEVFKELEKEVKAFLKTPGSSSEHHVRETWLIFALDFFSLKGTTDNQDFESIWRILDEDHYGLKKIKQRVFEELVVKSLNPQKKGAILCFVGPPGTGKTSIGCSIARAMGRKFIRMSLGAVRDEAEIRGHKRTYVAALPGKILEFIRRSGSKNPVFMIDEIDKIGKDQLRGNIDSALLEVLDPAQNFSFVDHYLGLEADLSEIVFITTANSLEDIAEPLRDRMEIINFRGYVNEEKVVIARGFLIPKQMKEHGLLALKDVEVDFSEGNLLEMINSYTGEAGVRELERRIGTILRKIAVEVCVKNSSGKWTIDTEKIKMFLGHPRNLIERIKQGDVGTAWGVSVGANGGRVIKIETLMVNEEGSGGIEITGNLGQVLEESVKIARSLIRSRIKTEKEKKLRNDIHVHVGDGATSKDGPSAGVAIFCSLYSRFKKKPGRKGVAMTGEIDLEGRILRVGGIKEKAIAVEQCGGKEFILPKENEVDLETLPKSAKENIIFHLVENIDEVLKIAF